MYIVKNSALIKSRHRLSAHMETQFDVLPAVRTSKQILNGREVRQ